jgi:predicted Fe-S protein YdhL (DUF1289 family)
MAGGRQNCKRCTRWRPISDFKVRKTKHGETPEGVCTPCHRARERERWANKPDAEKKRIMNRINARKAQRLADAKQVRAARRELIGSRRGSLLPITPFRMWLLGRLRWYGSVDEVERRTGLSNGAVRKYLDGYEFENDQRHCEPHPILTVPMAIVDKALTNEGSTHLNLLYETREEE